MTPNSATSLTGSYILGRYRIGDQVGHGGMGWVYEANDEVLHRDVAIKVLKQELAEDPEILERFRREASIAASLSHRGIAQVLDFAEENGNLYLVMELLRGRDLSRVLSEEGPMDPSRAADVARQVAEALQLAHERGAVHRDIKPGNIFLTDSGEVKVTDFGIATAAEQSSLTRTGDILGTAFYLSPEQVRGMPATPLSDLYALGCVLFEMVTGRPPFSAETSVATAMARLEGAAPRAGEYVPGLPPAFEDVMETALAQEPRDRFPSAGSMAEALAQAFSPTTIRMTASTGPRTEVLRPDTPVKKSVQLTDGPVEPGKRPWAAVAAVAIGVVLLVLLARECGADRSGPASVRLPSVVGVSFEDAKARLEKDGLSVRRAPDELSDQPAGVVFRQSPNSGATLDQDSPVTLFVSSGKGIAIPSLVNLSLSAAARELQTVGLTGTVVARVPGPESGTITAQDPPAGTMVAPETRIKLTITGQTEQDDAGRDGADGADGQDGEDGEKGGRGKARDKG